MPHRHRTSPVRHRLSSIAPPERAGIELVEPQPVAPEPVDPVPTADRPSVPSPRWVRRWVPESWHGARTDPGRRGAVALAAVATCAAIIAAFGMWRDRPVAVAPPPLPALVAGTDTDLADTDAADTDAADTDAADTDPGVTPGAAGGEPDAEAVAEVVVSVAGAVAAPGLVTLAPGSRVADAVTAAGGALPGTDLTTINLAQPLADGEQVLVGVAGPAVSGGGAAPADGGPPGKASPVDLNTATVSELEELPGVGPVLAQAIVDHRTDHGGFTAVEQLTDVAGIGPTRFERLRELVGV